MALACVFSCAADAASASRARPSRPGAPTDGRNAYKGAILIDAATGDVLFEDRADVSGPPASMAKLMTFAVVHDALKAGHLALNTPVPITRADAAMGGTQVYLDPRETYPVEELIYAMMIQSANDAAHALARAAAGSVEAFVARMNAKAAEIGMRNTKFRSPHGLPPASRRIAEGDLTTPRDFALLSRHLLQHTDVLRYSSVRLRSFGEGVRAQPMQMVNHNKLIGKVAGVDGLKTGFTNGAGFCLSATAQRNGRRVIVVVMGSPQSKVRDLKVTELIDRGFAALPAGPPVIALDQTGTAPAANAAANPPAPTLVAPATPAPAEPKIIFSIPKR